MWCEVMCKKRLCLYASVRLTDSHINLTRRSHSISRLRYINQPPLLFPVQDLGFLSSPWQTVTSLHQCEPRPSWLGGSLPAHAHDLNRAEDHLRGVGYVGDDEVAEQMRDWNDDYQACREVFQCSMSDTDAHKCTQTLHAYPRSICPRPPCV